MDKLFVYGIFLGERQRQSYGMVNPRYATVRDYATVGVMPDGYIVSAVECKGAVLTGLLVDIPSSQWERLDALEAGYTRVQITTTSNERAYMYAEANTPEGDNREDKRGNNTQSSQRPQEQRV